MKSNKIRPIFLLILLLFLLPVPTSNATERTVKVACILDHGFFYLTENREIEGYNYDYLQLLAQYNHWNYEYVVIDEGNSSASYQKAIEMMELGQVDLIGTVFPTEENQEIFAFPASHTGISRYCLMSLGTNYKITMDNYFMQEIISIALINNQKINQDFQNLFDLRNIPYQITYVDTYQEALTLLKEEKVDTMLMTDTSVDSWMVNYLTTISRTPFYFVADKENTSLVAELEEAISALNVVDPSVHQTLLGEYFGKNYAGQIRLSETEQAILGEYDSLSVGLMKNLPPYAVYPSDGTAPYGISLEVLESISHIIGIDFHYVWVDSREELTEKLITQEVDLCGAMPTLHEIAEELNVIMSDPYISSGTLWLRRNNEISETALTHLVSGNIPYFEKENTESIYDVESAILDLSEKGTTNIFCERNIAKYYLHHLGIDNIDFQTVSNVSANISIGMGKHLDYTIMSLLNNSLKYLDSNEIEEIILQNTTFTEVVSWQTFFDEHALFFSLIIVLILSVIVFGLFYHSSKLKKITRLDSMTKLTNSGYFHKYAEETTHHLSCGCLVLVDIDFFKQVNDTYGHQKGDEIIQIVADSLKNQFRTGDMVARLGGDEFAVLLETSCVESDLEQKFSHLQEILAENSSKIPVSLSVGGYIFTNPIKYAELYNLADDNLYKVKEKGRNGYIFTSSST